MSEERLPRIGISIGDLNGVGMELIIKTFSDPEILELCTPVVFGSTKVVSYHRNAIEMRDFNFHIIQNAEDALEGKANLVNCWKEEVKMDFGKVDPVVGGYAVKSLEAACDAVDSGKVDALVTAPINKESIQSSEFQFSGHTDYLESRYKSKATMMFLSPDLKLALATVHIPLAKVSEKISAKLVEQKIMAIHQSLKQDFHLPKGRGILYFCPMISIGKSLVSEEVLSEQFVCDLQKCKGACCVEGDAGAPLEEDEVRILKEEYSNFKD